LTKIEHLIKAFGTPVVSKVQEKYPGYMTTVDAKVDTAVTLLLGIWAHKIAPSSAMVYAKSALALTPEKLEELKATREAYFAKIEQTLVLLKAKAIALPEQVTTAVQNAIAEAREKILDAHLFEKVKAAYETVLKYPAVVAVLEKTAPYAAKAMEVAGPYATKAVAIAEPYATKAKTIAAPYVTKATEFGAPFVTAIREKVMPAKPVEQLD